MSISLVVLIVSIILVWVMSAVYVMCYHNKRWTLGLDVIIGAILLGPLLVFLVRRHGEEEKKEIYGVMERESNNQHRGWFRTMSEINRQRMTSFGRTIPPPISRIEPPNRRPNNKKDFKFFH